MLNYASDLGVIQEIHTKGTCAVKLLYLKGGAEEIITLQTSQIRKCLPVLSAELLNTFLEIGMEILIDYYGAEKITPVLNSIKSSFLNDKVVVPRSAIFSRLDEAIGAIEIWIERQCPSLYAPSMCPRTANSYIEWIRSQLG